jgi:hypothetical protein
MKKLLMLSLLCFASLSARHDSEMEQLRETVGQRITNIQKDHDVRIKFKIMSGRENHAYILGLYDAYIDVYMLMNMTSEDRKHTPTGACEKYCEKNIEQIDSYIPTINAEYDRDLILLMYGARNAYEDVKIHSDYECWD